jgi:hypothetical protein
MSKLKIFVRRQTAIVAIIQSLSWIMSGLKIEKTPNWRKRKVLKEILSSKMIKTFVETGTYLGLTSKVASRIVLHVYTIELSKILFTSNLKKYSNYKNISFMYGQSEHELQKVLNMDLSFPICFFLDAHFSEGLTQKSNRESALELEVKSILNFVRDFPTVVIIDDFVALNGTNGYLSLDDVISQLGNHNFRFKQSNNMLFCENF